MTTCAPVSPQGCSFAPPGRQDVLLMDEPSYALAALEEGGPLPKSSTWEATKEWCKELRNVFKDTYGFNISRLLFLVSYMLSPLVAVSHSLHTRTLIRDSRDEVYATSFVFIAIVGLVAVLASVTPCKCKALRELQEDLKAPHEQRGNVSLHESMLSGSLCKLLQRLMPYLFGSWFWGLAPLSSLNVPYWIIRVVRFADVPLTCRPAYPDWITALKFVADASFYTCGIFFAALALGTPWWLSYAAINRKIKHIDFENIPDWDLLQSEVHNLDLLLETLWRWHNSGAPWLCGLLGCVGYAFHGLEAVLAGDVQNSQIGVLALVAGSIGFVTVLFALSSITTMCQSTGASANSIVAAAQRYPSRRSQEKSGKGLPMVRTMNSKARAAHSRFMHYMKGTEMGVEVCGVLVTFSLVASIIIHLSIAIPTVYKILDSVMQSRQPLSSHALKNSLKLHMA